MSQPVNHLIAVPEAPMPVPGYDLVRGLNELEATVRQHMGFIHEPVRTIIDIQRSTGGDCLLVSFVIRGSEDAHDARVHMRSLPGYTVFHTQTSPAGMRHKVTAFVK